MLIESIVCPDHIEEKLESKHKVTFHEARQVLFNSLRFRFVEKGYSEGEDVYVAFGQTFGGRYLSVFFIHKPTTRVAIIISGRDMSPRERRAYGPK